MNKRNMTAMAATIGLVFNAGVMAETMSKDTYKAAEDRIAAEYTSLCRDPCPQQCPLTTRDVLRHLGLVQLAIGASAAPKYGEAR